MFRLQDEVVLGAGNEQLYKGSPSRARPKALFDDVVEIGSPAPKIIVDIYAGDACRASPLFQRGDGLPNVPRSFEQFVAARKFKIVDDVDQQ